MKRYFFDLKDGAMIEDKTGLDLVDDEAAQDHAVGLAEDVLQGRSENGHTHPWQIIIKDADGHMLGTVTSVTV